LEGLRKFKDEAKVEGGERPSNWFESPSVELRYEREWSWQNWITPEGILAGAQMWMYTESGEPMKYLGEPLGALKNLTKGNAITIEGAAYRFVLPEDVREKIETLPEEEWDKLNEELYSVTTVVLPVSGIEVVAKFIPLIVDLYRRESYYPVQIFLRGSSFTEWDEAKWEDLWERVDSIKGWLQEKLHERTSRTTMEMQPEVVSPPSRYLLDAKTRIDKQAAAFLAHVGGLNLPRKWGSIKVWEDLRKERIASLREDPGEDQALKTVQGVRGPLLVKKSKPNGETVLDLSEEAEEALLAEVGHKGFRRVIHDKDGQNREYLIKRFRAGTGYVEIRLAWYGQAWPLVDEGRTKAEAELEEIKKRLQQTPLFHDLQEADRKELDSHLRMLESIRDGRLVMETILTTFGRDGENPVKMPSWQLRTLLQCENDPDGFRKVEGCLRALQEVRFHLQVTSGTGVPPGKSFGPFLGQVRFIPAGPGRHTDGDWHITIEEDFIGSLRVFQTGYYKLKDARKALLYDFGKKLSKEEKSGLEFIQGFSALGPYYDHAKGFTDQQSNLRRWIESQITLNKDAAKKGRKGLQVRGNAPNAGDPRLYGHDFCPLIPEGKHYQGALGHYLRNPEVGRKLAGTATSSTKTGGGHTEGLLAVMGYPLPPGKADTRRTHIVGGVLKDLRAVVEEAIGGIVAGRRPDGKWLTLKEASELQVDEITKNVTWYLFLPQNWTEKRAEDYEKHHAERRARGEVDYPIKITTSRAEAEQSQNLDGGTWKESEPLRIRLYMTRKERGLTQKEAGRIFGVSAMVVAYWEKGAERDEIGKRRGKDVSRELVPLVERWIKTGEVPSPEELAGRKNRRSGVRKD